MNQRIVLSKNATGIQKDISIDDQGKIRLSDVCGRDEFVIGYGEFHKGELLDLCHAVGVDVGLPFSEGLINSYNAVYGEEIDWIRALGKKKFVEKISHYLKEVSQQISFADPQNYLRFLAKNRHVLESLEQAKVDSKLLSEALRDRESANLKSLQHSVDGFCDVVRYSHKSQTGRMTVKSGPKVLLLQKEDRKFFIPADSDHVLAQVDFVSLEPRVAYLLTHDSSPIDIYNEMGNKLGGDISRSKLKIATISALYGSAKIEQSILRQVSSFFEIEKIHREYLGVENLYNLYGRPLHPENEHLRLPHFIQSTAVDVALQAFSYFVDQHDIKPYFMIHDSLVFECSNETYREIKESGLKVSIDKLGDFYMSISKFVDDEDS